MSKPHSKDAPEATTYHQLQRNRDAVGEVGDEKPGGDISSLPPLPKSSPWGVGPAPGDEPPVDRREDSDTTDMTEG
jgi:hypothetical protein